MIKMLNVYGNEMMPLEDCIYIGDKPLSSFEVEVVSNIDGNFDILPVYRFEDSSESVYFINIDSGSTCEVISTNTESTNFNVDSIAINTETGDLKLLSSTYDEEGGVHAVVAANIAIIESIVVITECGTPEYIEKFGGHYYMIKLIEKPIQMLDEACRWKFPMIAKYCPGLILSPNREEGTAYAHGGADMIMCVPARGEPLVGVISFSKYSMYANMIEKSYQYYDAIAASLANYDGIRVGTLVKLVDYRCFEFVKQGQDLTNTFICRIIAMKQNFMNLKLESDIRHDFSQMNILIPISVSDFFTFCSTIFDDNACILTPTHKIFQKNHITVVLPVTGKESKLIDETMRDYLIKPKLKKYLQKDFGFDDKQERTIAVFNVRDNNEIISWQTKYYPDIDTATTD